MPPETKADLEEKDRAGSRFDKREEGSQQLRECFESEKMQGLSLSRV